MRESSAIETGQRGCGLVGRDIDGDHMSPIGKHFSRFVCMISLFVYPERFALQGYLSEEEDRFEIVSMVEGCTYIKLISFETQKVVPIAIGVDTIKDKWLGSILV
eukprot:Phypoly_transcript_22585.p1 GENE.Phypoly_transcript_22585~~Phypoly_transcript_22585.p1  ORF type:complete len:105 (-),score=8.53 Phypoly_transcript_22585:13-327(-)